MLVIDVGPMMDIAPPTGGDTALEDSLRIANQIVLQKVSFYKWVWLIYTHISILSSYLLVLKMKWVWSYLALPPLIMS